MVLVGHSQGGLLVKLQAISSGDRFWRMISEGSFEEAQLEPKTRALLFDALFFEPQRCVKDVIFVATPHRGSFMAANWMGRFASRLFTAPDNLLDVPRQFTRASLDAGGGAIDAAVDGFESAFGVDDAVPRFRLERIPSSVENMDPDRPFIQTLSVIPLDEGIRAHSIIPVHGGPPPEGQNDGVVDFEAARIDGAESEFVVFRSGHSVQSHPLAIQEVRRVLLRALPQEAGRLPEASD